MSRLTISILIFGGATGLADLIGKGHDYRTIAAILIGTLGAATFIPPHRWRSIFALMLAVSIAMAAIAVEQLWFMARPRGLFASANFLGGYAALHLFLAIFYDARIKRRFRWFTFAALTANGLALVLSQSRGALAAAAAGIAVMMWRKRPHFVAAAAVAGLTAVAYLSQTRAPILQDARFTEWRLGIAVVRQHALLGLGHGVLFNRFYNSALELAVNCGIVGLAAGIWMMLCAARAAGQETSTQQRMALLGLLAAWTVNSMVMFDTAATTLPLFVVIAYLASEYRDVTRVTRLVDDHHPLFRDGLVTGGERAE